MKVQGTVPDLGTLRLHALVRIGFGVAWLTAGTRFPRFKIGSDSLWQPVSLAAWFDSAPSVDYLALIQTIATLSTLCLIIGLRTRTAAIATLVSSALFQCLIMSWGKVGHTTQAMLLVLLVMSFSDWGACLSVDGLVRRLRGRTLRSHSAGWPDWPTWMSVFVLALMYGNSGAHKLLKGDADRMSYFLDSGLLQFLKSRLVLWETKPSPQWVQDWVLWLVQHPAIVNIATYATVAFELFFFVSLLSPRLRVVMLFGMVAFHGSIGALAAVFFPAPIVLASLLLIPTLALALRDHSTVLTRWLPRTEVALQTPKWPVWTQTGVGIALCLAALYSMAPLVPENLPVRLGYTIAKSLTFGLPMLVIPRSHTVYLTLALLGSIGAAIAFAAFIRQITSGIRKRRSNP